MRCGSSTRAWTGSTAAHGANHKAPVRKCAHDNDAGTAPAPAPYRSNGQRLWHTPRSTQLAAGPRHRRPQAVPQDPEDRRRRWRLWARGRRPRQVRHAATTVATHAQGEHATLAVAGPQPATGVAYQETKAHACVCPWLAAFVGYEVGWRRTSADWAAVPSMAVARSRSAWCGGGRRCHSSTGGPVCMHPQPLRSPQSAGGRVSVHGRATPTHGITTDRRLAQPQGGVVVDDQAKGARPPCDERFEGVHGRGGCRRVARA